MKKLDEKLHAAVRSRNSKKVVKLIDKGANVNSQDDMGYTPLFEAAIQRNFLITTFLLDNGADVNVRSNKGHTVLHWVKSTQAVTAFASGGAERESHALMINLLEAYGAIE